MAKREGHKFPDRLYVYRDDNDEHYLCESDLNKVGDKENIIAIGAYELADTFRVQVVTRLIEKSENSNG